MLIYYKLNMKMVGNVTNLYFPMNYIRIIYISKIKIMMKKHIRMINLTHKQEKNMSQVSNKNKKKSKKMSMNYLNMIKTQVKQRNLYQI